MAAVAPVHCVAGSTRATGVEVWNLPFFTTLRVSRGSRPDGRTHPTVPVCRKTDKCGVCECVCQEETS